MSLSGWTGRIDYRRGRDGPSWGAEDWAIRKGVDKLRTLTADCRMNLEGREVFRHVVYAVDAEFHPHDALSHITVNGRFQGSAWYRFTDEQAECEGFNTEEGRVSLTLPISRQMRGFGTHPLQADAWLMARLDYSSREVQSFTGNLLTSTDHLGASGPSFRTVDSAIQVVGTEAIETPAGSFACHHLRFASFSNNHPPYDLWVTDDGEFHFVRGIVGGYMDSTFELVERQQCREWW